MPTLPPPARKDPGTVWFEAGKDPYANQGDGETWGSTTIRALGGAVEPQLYSGFEDGYYGGTKLPCLEYADLRESGWKEIGDYYFYGLTKLKHVVLPPRLEMIGEDAFKSCISLTEIRFPEGLKVVRSGAFVDCYALTEVVFPPGFEDLRWAFHDCKALRRVELPSVMKHIGTPPFPYCDELKTLVVGDVEDWEIDCNESEEEYNILGSCVELQTLHLIGRRWELVPPGLANSLAPDARVIGRNFVGKKLGAFTVTAK